AAHVVTLGRDATGRMLAGTESPGRLYRFDAGDKPFVILDAGAAEVKATASDTSGAIYAAAVTKSDDASGAEPATVAATIAIAPPATSASTSGSSSSGNARRSILYRVE